MKTINKSDYPSIGQSNILNSKELDEAVGGTCDQTCKSCQSSCKSCQKDNQKGVILDPGEKPQK